MVNILAIRHRLLIEDTFNGENQFFNDFLQPVDLVGLLANGRRESPKIPATIDNELRTHALNNSFDAAIVDRVEVFNLLLCSSHSRINY